jgi:hypothetical protein
MATNAGRRGAVRLAETTISMDLRRKQAGAACFSAAPGIATPLAPLEPVVDPRPAQFSAEELSLQLRNPPSDQGWLDRPLGRQARDRQWLEGLTAQRCARTRLRALCQ